MATAAPAPASTRGKARTVLLLILGIVAMTGVAWASVPLYRLFCQVTGFNGTTQRGEQAPGAVGGVMRIDFDANVNPRLPWRFAPEAASAKVRIGEKSLAFFTATNRAAVPVAGTATFNVTPSHVGKYFTKIQCFCFTEQTLKPGETMRMPVIYYVDPAILKDADAADVETITLSYTFYPVDSGKTPG